MSQLEQPFENMTVLELRKIARSKGVRLSAGISKQGIVQALYDSMDVVPSSLSGGNAEQTPDMDSNDTDSKQAEPVKPAKRGRKPLAEKSGKAVAEKPEPENVPKENPEKENVGEVIEPIADAAKKDIAVPAPNAPAESVPVRHVVLIADDDEEDEYDDLETPILNPSLARAYAQGAKAKSVRPAEPVNEPAPYAAPSTPKAPVQNMPEPQPIPPVNEPPMASAARTQPSAPQARPISKNAPVFPTEGVRAWHNPHAQPYQKGGYGAPTRTTSAWQPRAATPPARPGAPLASRAPDRGMQPPRAQYTPRFGPDADTRDSGAYARRDTPAWRAPETGYQNSYRAPEPQTYRDQAPRDPYRGGDTSYSGSYRQPDNSYASNGYYRQQETTPADPYRNAVQSPYQDTPAIGVPEMLAAGECADVSGILEIHPDGYGFLRQNNYLQSKNDVYISNAQIRRFQLRTGDYVEGKARPQRETDKYCAMLYITSINGESSDEVKTRARFEDLTPIYPDRRIQLEGDESSDLSIRMMDLVAPLGFGQRAMIVAPPKAGKTTILKKLAAAIAQNYPEVHLMMLLVDERPEEVTDFKECVKGEVLYSTFDEPPENHIRVAELVLERAMRLVENKKDVVILMDSLTRLSRAYNATAPQTSRAMSGGLAAGVLQKPKRFFGAARNLREGGSLTVIATALVETGSRMDDIIFEEFKGTGNMELHLDRRLSEKRVFPAVSLTRSGTRREELLLTEKELAGARDIRSVLSSANEADATSQLIEMMERAKTNEQLIDRLKDWIGMMQRAGYAMTK